MSTDYRRDPRWFGIGKGTGGLGTRWVCSVKQYQLGVAIGRTEGVVTIMIGHPQLCLCPRMSSR